jgi:hypothetical protein
MNRHGIVSYNFFSFFLVDRELKMAASMLGCIWYFQGYDFKLTIITECIRQVWRYQRGEQCNKSKKDRQYNDTKWWTMIYKTQKTKVSAIKSYPAVAAIFNSRVEDLVATPRCMFLVSLFWRWDVVSLTLLHIRSFFLGNLQIYLYSKVW